MVSAQNLFRAALGLALALGGVAGLYLFMEAEFLAMAQLLVYVGAILTLLVFGVMLTAKIADPKISRWNDQVGVVFWVSILVGLGLASAYMATPWMDSPATWEVVSIQTIGRALLGPYLLVFELLSLLLVGALVGAIVIARKEPK